MSIRPEYLETIFIAKPPKDGWPRRFFVITPCNPLGCGEREGDGSSVRNLRRELSRRGCWRHRVTGASSDWKHREAGFAVGDLSLKDAVRLGRDYEQNAIFAVRDDRLRVVSCRGRSREELGSFSERLFSWLDEPKFRIYVVRLKVEVLGVKRFLKANPGYKDGKPCYYVGMTGLTAEERYKNHKAGYKCCSLVRDYGARLERKRFKSIPLLSLADARSREVSHAELLRSKGYGVWQK
jgi:hypothetical protein